jgi:hypothetical protein
MKTGIKTNQKVNYTQMSNKKCKVCKAPLKQNVVNRNPNACLCYVCFKLSKGKTQIHKYDGVGSFKKIIKTIDLKKVQLRNIQTYR